MLVVDTSALVSLAVGGVVDETLEEFTVATTRTVVTELEHTSRYDDQHGDGAANVLDSLDRIEIAEDEGGDFETGRIDAGEASCIETALDRDAEFLITDDLRALPEIESVVDAEVALSPIVLRALVERGALSESDAERAFETIAEGRDWLGAPIYRYARRLFE